MRATLRWEPPTYHPKDRIADATDVGRYYIKRCVDRGKRPSKVTFRLKLNGAVLGEYDSGEEAVGVAERDAFKRLKD